MTRDTTCLIERQQMQIKSTIAENGPREKRVQSDNSLNHSINGRNMAASLRKFCSADEETRKRNNA